MNTEFWKMEAWEGEKEGGRINIKI